MNRRFLISLIIIAAQFSLALAKEDRIGFAINTSMNGEIYPIRLVPTVTYLKGRSQWELGFGFHPFIHEDQKILSSEANYKFYPNKTENKFNLYLITRFSYVKNRMNTYYPTTYHYLFLNGGYGVEVNAFKNVYMGTNMSVGAFTYSKNSENPYADYGQQQIFEELGFNLAFQFNVGYRF